METEIAATSADERPAAGGARPSPGLGAHGLGQVSGLRGLGAAPLSSSSGPRLDDEKSPLPWVSFGLCLSTVCHTAREAVSTRQARGMQPGTTSGDTCRGVAGSHTTLCCFLLLHRTQGLPGRAGRLLEMRSE